MLRKFIDIFISRLILCMLYFVSLYFFKHREMYSTVDDNGRAGFESLIDRLVSATANTSGKPGCRVQLPVTPDSEMHVKLILTTSSPQLPHYCLRCGSCKGTEEAELHPSSLHGTPTPADSTSERVEASSAIGWHLEAR